MTFQVRECKGRQWGLCLCVLLELGPDPGDLIAQVRLDGLDARQVAQAPTLPGRMDAVPLRPSICF